MDQKELGAVIVILIIFALGGVGYIYVFGPLGLNYSPVDSQQGIQMSPGENCQKICIEGVFNGCKKSFQDFECGVSCKGIINKGSSKTISPVVGSTLCEYVDCVCS